MGEEVGFVAAVEADLPSEGAVGLEFGPAVAARLVHLVVAGPGEVHRIAVTASEDMAGATRLGAGPILNQLRGPQSMCLPSTTPFDEAIRRLGPGRVVEPR